MRLMPSLLACSLILPTLFGCGTKTPLTLPPPAQQKSSLVPAVAPAATSPAESRQ